MKKQKHFYYNFWIDEILIQRDECWNIHCEGTVLERFWFFYRL